MSDRIQDAIHRLEDELGFTALAAWETGSRAYNFYNEGSDNDISILYIQPRESYILDSNYLKGFANHSINLELPDNIEFNGWDIRRFRELLLHYDPMIFEALNSPIAYQTSEELETITEHLTNRINPIEMFNHYQSAAKSIFYSQREDDGLIDQKYMFHVSRNILIAQYIRETKEFPPLDYEEFLREAPPEIFIEFSREKARQLLSDKRDATKSNEQINPINEERIYEFFDYELEYQSYIPDEAIDAEFIDAELQSLITGF